MSGDSERIPPDILQGFYRVMTLHAQADDASMFSWKYPILDQNRPFTYWTKNEPEYQWELQKIRNHVISGAIEKPKAGDDFLLGEVTLYPMLVKYKEKCPAHFFLQKLQKPGLQVEDADYTPYYFKELKDRNEALAFINNPSGACLFYDLDDLSRQINNALSDDASLIFWAHATGYPQSDQFNYFKSEDEAQYHKLLKELREKRRSGVIIEAKAGDDFIHGEVRFFTMLVKFRGVQCGAHFLIQKRGLIDDMDYTPHYFKCLNARNKALAFINKPSNMKGGISK